MFANLVFPRWKKLGFCASAEQRWQLGLDIPSEIQHANRTDALVLMSYSIFAYSLTQKEDYHEKDAGVDIHLPNALRPVRCHW
jgi:hypothetical protein